MSTLLPALPIEAETIAELAAQRTYDHILVETTGVAEPRGIADLFTRKNAFWRSLGDFAQLSALVTVVDALNLLADYSSTDLLSARGETAGEGDDRSLVSLLVEQIEFADVVIVNKASAVSPEQLATVKQVVASLNADARIIEADFGTVALDTILDTGLYDEERSEQHPLWMKELYDYASHRPESEEYGVESS